MNGLAAACSVELLGESIEGSLGDRPPASRCSRSSAACSCSSSRTRSARASLACWARRRSWRPGRPTGRHSWRSSPRPSRSVARCCSRSSSPGSSAGVRGPDRARSRRLPHVTLGDRHRKGRRRIRMVHCDHRLDARVRPRDRVRDRRAGLTPGVVGRHGSARLRGGGRGRGHDDRPAVVHRLLRGRRTWLHPRPRVGGPRDFSLFAQILAALGWGAWFPWSVPALVSGAAGPDAEAVSAGGVAIVVITAFLGLVATLVWWDPADQTG